MPVDFLTPDQEQAYGRYDGEPSSADLERIFHLDDADHALIAERRGASNKLGLALQLCTVRYLGAFLEDPLDVPPGVVATLARQLGLSDHTDLGPYRAGDARWDHTAEIRRRYGYRDFGDQPGHLRFVRWLYARAWTGAERPSALFAQAVARLVAAKVLLPGVSVLERLVARVRDRAAARLWRRLAALPSSDQRAALERLVLTAADDGRQTPLDRLRHGPVHANSVTLVAALKRLAEVRALGVSQLDLAGLPAGRIRVLARHAATSRAQALERLTPDRRVATLLAFARALEATALDDALDVFDRVLDEILRGATRTGTKERLRTARALDTAALILRDVARIVRDAAVRSADVRDAVASEHGDATIDAAIAVVDGLARPPDDHYQREILAQYPTVRRFLPALLRTIRFAGTASAGPLLTALAFLAALEEAHPPDIVEAPLAAVPTAWRHRVVSPDDRPGYHVDRRAYTFAVLEQAQAALRRRDLFVAPSEKWADPRTALLQGAAWEAARPRICRALNLALDPAVQLAALGAQLDQAYRRTADHLPTNPDVRIERREGRDRLVLTPLERLDEPASLRWLRATVDDRLPHAELPEVLLEIHGVTGFAEAFTHVSEEHARVADLPTSVCAVLLAEACNVGLRAVAREDIPALTLDRLSWVKHNYVREETLARANARLVDYHQTVPSAKAWGGGEIASVDGLRFKVPVKTLNAGLSPTYFGVGRGATWLNMASGPLGLHGVVVPGTLRDSGRILDVVLEQPTSLRPTEIVSDTAGYSDIVFGIFALLGYQFSPRLADLGDQRLWRIDPKAEYGPLDGVARNHIKPDLIARHWDDLLRLAGSLAEGMIAGSAALRTLQSGGRYSTLGRAAAEYGRIAKSLFMLPYLDDQAHRRRVLHQINRQEGRHRLARALCYGQKGELRQHYKEGQEDQLAALGLVLNAVILWNTRYAQRALETLHAEGVAVRPEDSERLSPLGFDHITILGRYQFVVPESIRRGEFRPLRPPTTSEDAKDHGA